MEGEERREEEEEEIQAVRKLYRLTKSHVIIDDATDGQTDSAEKDVRFFVWPVLFEAVDNIPYLKASLRYSGLFVKLIPEPPTIPSHRWRSPNRIFHLPFMKATLAALPIGDERRAKDGNKLRHSMMVRGRARLPTGRQLDTA